MAWYGTIELRALNGKVTTKRWKMQNAAADGAAFLAVLSDLQDIASALTPITNATIQDIGVQYLIEAYNAGAGDITEQALINVWAEDPANSLDVLALSQQYIPAPVIGLFAGTSGALMDQVDINDAALGVYVDALAAGAFVSDHEVIDTGAGSNGMENGRRVTRKS
jgi:hypothetical protein